MKLNLFSLGVAVVFPFHFINAFQPFQNHPVANANPHRLPSELEFQIHGHDYEKDGSQAVVFEVPVRQEGIKMYIANDGKLQNHRPGNGGMRMMSYESQKHAIEDAVRLAEGMTRKHAMYNTGFSGAKLVVNHGDVDLDDVDRSGLMADCASALERLSGCVWTGCDINTNDEDMQILSSHTPYVLAGLDSTVDTNKATAMSVIGSIMGILQAHDEQIEDNTFLVQGCGKVGSHVAQELVRLGAKDVKTCDIEAERALIPGCSPLKNGQEWFHQQVDFLVPCANSFAINEQVLQEMKPPRFIVGATNQPYASAEVRASFDEKGSFHVPESISSAGAILADSVEWTHPDLFRGGASSSQVYGWIRDLSKDKANQLCRKAGNDAKAVLQATEEVYADSSNDPIGQTFPDWILENTVLTDCVIVGGGMAGTAAAYANSKAGIKTLLVEQGDSLAPKTASSNGDSRMYRQMYSNPFFSQMQTKALDMWKVLEEECGEQLLHQNGLLFYGEDTKETVEGSVQGARNTMKELGLPHEYFTSGNAIFERFPALKTRDTPYSGVYEETAGHVRASAACAAMAKVATQSGLCKVLNNCEVTDIRCSDEKDHLVTIVLKDGLSVIAKSLILAPGAWTNHILQSHFDMSLDLDIWRIHWAHYEIDACVDVPQSFFFRKESDCGNDGGLYYFFPATATESCAASSPNKKIIKVGVDFKTTESVDVPRSMKDFEYDTMYEVLQMMDDFVSEHLGGNPKRVEAFVSPYTMTKDSFFIMDTLPQHPNVALFSGGSGRAFKFAPLIGDCLSRLARGDTDFLLEDLSCFSMRRVAAGLKMNQSKSMITLSTGNVIIDAGGIAPVLAR
ncbi:glutamate dehydrogenase/leucine dehydrogenase [Nitzschia inconspicua]|uniref:Glutamate dehydrogenase/leucine dehydrogenase n=1 Tax=Nitzschia inconspicua TaxID=303405 RepID=A0A9K3Q500_9STRA|nr:glutamate dehydrogenase/leucine dehydrogenase [Nitzschia inconspicua]